MTLVVSEVFGPTVQGEGRNLGLLASFVRLGGCNLHCTWCDTAYTWDARRYDLRAELNRRPVADIINDVAKIGADRVIISGGEPLLHQDQDGWAELLGTLHSLGYKIEIETNGTVMPSLQTVEHTELFTVSPKLEQGDPEHARIKPDVLHAFTTLPAVFKIVCADLADVDDAHQLIIDQGLPPANCYLMGEGATLDDMIASTTKIATAAVDHGLNLTTRLHLLAWGSERGH